jgi:8-oxo-dGTP pyrophosphatase MutT (NUDIX family)
VKHEIVDIVDQDYEVVGSAMKAEAHRSGLLHRVVVAAVRDERARFVLVKQAQNRQDAGQLVFPVGGHVMAGESDTNALYRESREEIGVDGFKAIPACRLIFDRKVCGRHENHYFSVFHVVADPKTFVLGCEATDIAVFTERELKRAIVSKPEQFGEAFYVILHNLFPGLLARAHAAI